MAPLHKETPAPRSSRSGRFIPPVAVIDDYRDRRLQTCHCLNIFEIGRRFNQVRASPVADGFDLKTLASSIFVAMRLDGVSSAWGGRLVSLSCDHALTLAGRAYSFAEQVKRQGSRAETDVTNAQALQATRGCDSAAAEGETGPRQPRLGQASPDKSRAAERRQELLSEDAGSAVSSAFQFNAFGLVGA